MKLKRKNLIRFSKIAIPLVAVFLVLCSQERSFLKTIGFSVNNKQVEADQESLQTALKLQQAFRNITSSVSPAVVNIRTEKTVAVKSPFRDFFNDPFFRRFFGDREPQQERKQQALGSGFIISPDGYILSNYHVVAGADKISVFLEDNRVFQGTVVGSDEKTDLALIKIDTKGADLPVAPLGDSESIHVGDFAIAIGNPFGLTSSVTFGVISATGRVSAIDENAPFKRYIQTDVSINPGNSGGPLLNIKGQVVGVNSAIFSTSGGSIGIGFAIPINIAKNVVTQLIEKGKVERGYIGAFVQDVNEQLAKYHDLETTQGVILTKIEEGSPADKAGLKSGDVVLELNGKKVRNASELISMISSRAPGAKITFTIQREGEKKKIPVTIGERKEEIAKAQNGDYWLGLQFGSLDKYSEQYRIPNQINRGVVVIDVKEQSPAFEVGIRPGDIVDMINNRAISDIQALNQFINANKDREKFLLRVIRGGRIYFVVLEKQD
jgi:serine protease Do